MVPVSQARSARLSSAGGQVAVSAALLALAVWRPAWVSAAVSWYFARVQALSAYLAGSQQLKAAFVWYVGECQAFGALIARSMFHR